MLRVAHGSRPNVLSAEIRFEFLCIGRHCPFPELLHSARPCLTKRARCIIGVPVVMVEGSPEKSCATFAAPISTCPVPPLEFQKRF